MKKLLKKIVRRMFKSQEFQELLSEYILTEPRVVGPVNRLHISRKAAKNNFLVNTNSGEVHIHDYVFFGKNVSLITGTHDYNQINENRIKNFPSEGRDIIIEEGAWIASDSVVLGPCRIGKGAVVAAGSVVTKNVEEFVIVAGNPAKVVKKIDPRPPSVNTEI